MRTVNLNVVNMVCLNDRNDRLVNVARLTVNAILALCSRVSGFIAGSKGKATIAAMRASKRAAAMRWQASPYQPGATGGMGRLSHTTTVREQRGHGSSERPSLQSCNLSLTASAT